MLFAIIIFPLSGLCYLCKIHRCIYLYLEFLFSVIFNLMEGRKEVLYFCHRIAVLGFSFRCGNMSYKTLSENCNLARNHSRKIGIGCGFDIFRTFIKKLKDSTFSFVLAFVVYFCDVLCSV